MNIFKVSTITASVASLLVLLMEIAESRRTAYIDIRVVYLVSFSLACSVACMVYELQLQGRGIISLYLKRKKLEQEKKIRELESDS